MQLRTFAKRLVERLPESFAAPIVHLPFTVRLGASYSGTRRAILAEQRNRRGFDGPGQWESLREAVRFAGANTSFYRAWYAMHGFDPANLHSWEDWQRVPIVTRADMQRSSLADRCPAAARGSKVNTGGTSGQPLEFLLDDQALGREWAHMHFIWASHGYRKEHRKLTLRGKHFDPSTALRFNAVNNEYVANANVPMARIVDEVVAVTRLRPIRWVHGYPSLAAEFAIELSRRSTDIQAEVRDRLFGVLLGSEFPAPQYRGPISVHLSANIASWYGHSEMALLARETASGIYSTFPTYGFAEAVPTEDGSWRLVCTSLANRSHPFIRYDTGDRVEPVSSRRGVLEFRITEGRVGEFITDRRGHRHALTAVIFGRHHAAFELVRHMQVFQDAPGAATLVAVPRDPGLQPERILGSMDLSGLDVSWTVRLVDEPVRTRSGKIKLRLGPGDLAPA